jgi:AcrR family transcriptional regulator
LGKVQPETNALREQRRDALADFAIESLATHGYSRTSLRDIAQLSGMSLGRLHYYFESKADLVQYCVARYKQRFVAILSDATASAVDGRELTAALTGALVEAVRREGRVHRLWYDLRAEALFDEGLRHSVGDIEQSLRALVDQIYARLSDFGLVRQRRIFDSELVYLTLDAFFFRALQQHLSGEDPDCARFHASLQDFFIMLAGE